MPLLGRRAPKELSDLPVSLRLRKLADYSEGHHTRVKRWDPMTGEGYLADPTTGERKPWPLLGVTHEGEMPTSVTISTTLVNAGRQEGWIETEGDTVNHEPGGPPDNQWSTTHTFERFDYVTFNFVEGKYKYHVIHNPGKYAEPDGTMRVDWFYRLERVTA